jgi:hypothetical protein
MLYFTANKLTIKPCLKHLANELHLFVCCHNINSFNKYKTFILYMKQMFYIFLLFLLYETQRIFRAKSYY